jgi:type II restriction/modification system DNA methylase subunit YeeA
VRYLVENSLGRLWLLNRPNSRLIEKMEFYIKPQEEEKEYLRINSPEEIKICDPACGSGHMLTYAYDLLYQIYEEEGYDLVHIPRLILEKNLYGIEIDRRAGALAAFALTMKAREKDRRFFRRKVMPNVCVLENVTFTEDEIEVYLNAVGRGLFTQDLQFMLTQFEVADNFGALICPQVKDIGYFRERLAEKGIFDDLFLYATNQKVQQVLEQVEYLSPRYHVVVANPPYMGRGMNAELKDFARDQYPDSKSDLFAMFIERNCEMAQPKGLIGIITMQSWMFLSSFEKLRTNLLEHKTILSMAHLGPRAFDSIGGEIVSTTAFVVKNSRNQERKGSFLRLTDGSNEAEKATMLRHNLPSKGYHPLPSNYYTASASDFKTIPGAPIAYWASDKVIDIFRHKSLSDFAISGGRCKTHNDKLFVRMVWEIAYNKIGEDKK